MENNYKYIIELLPIEIEAITNLAHDLNEGPPSTNNPDLFCNKAKMLSKLLPNHIKDELMHFSVNGSPTGYLVIKNIPVENTPPTPSGNQFKVGETTLLARVQAIIISFFSDLIAYEAEGYGRLFQDIVPIKSMSAVQTSLGSNTELEIHTEQAFSKLRPDFLSLSCLRGDINANTYILPVQKILDNATENETDILRKPLWKTGVDFSFKLNGHEFIEGDIRGPLAILSGDKFDPQITFDQDLMTGVCDESQAMVKKIVDIYYKHRYSHNLKPGEIIIIDNRRALHGRSPFFPQFNGFDRFLIRCFSTLDYNKSMHARINNGRTIAAIYS
jgi:L-asparagine oxygenase